jgi:hypothetical protein
MLMHCVDDRGSPCKFVMIVFEKWEGGLLHEVRAYIMGTVDGASSRFEARL